jgi:hypothetical protein
MHALSVGAVSCREGCRGSTTAAVRSSARGRPASSGTPCNLQDGSVEVLAFGEERAVMEFIEWLWVGPSAAKVIHDGDELAV